MVRIVRRTTRGLRLGNLVIVLAAAALAAGACSGDPGSRPATP
ncbi:hypothetical protein [Thermocatellispora tengchongensis]